MESALKAVLTLGSGSHSATGTSGRCVPGSARRSKNASRLKREIDFDRRRPAQIESTNHRHNYGQLLILDAGAGGRIMSYATRGMFVVTGEPVAVMGGGAQSAVAKAGGVNQPVLYVEFRKDGVPVDPGPWWAANEGQKVRG
jgi:hypothetical protein